MNMSTAMVEYTDRTPSSGEENRLELLREMVRDYAANEMVDIKAPQFLWPILSPLEIGLTSELGWELGPTPDHQKYGWDGSYGWVIEAVKEIYPVWNSVEEEFGWGAMLNIEKPNITEAIARPAGAEFIGLERIENARKLRSAKGTNWYRKVLDFQFADR
ncbi:hypothetical protein NKJ06_03465 [Mesorhizobium sp. M0293]|uniref:hypothetical protein n=1 Tax=Mesorhizobium sp. M0293 TaxID=2956930 RepID=UPI00333C5136